VRGLATHKLWFGPSFEEAFGVFFWYIFSVRATSNRSALKPGTDRVAQDRVACWAFGSVANVKSGHAQHCVSSFVRIAALLLPLAANSLVESLKPHFPILFRCMRGAFRPGAKSVRLVRRMLIAVTTSESLSLPGSYASEVYGSGGAVRKDRLPHADVSHVSLQWFGEAEKLVKAIFTLASKIAPTVSVNASME
jgi:hypothetical protein